jgi:hypothetical protein
MEASLLCRITKCTHLKVITHNYLSACTKQPSLYPHVTHRGFASTIIRNHLSTSQSTTCSATNHPLRRAFSVGRPIGQPLHESHPHLIGAGECTFYLPISFFCFSNIWIVTKGIKVEEFKQRRDKLVANMLPGSVAIFYSAPEKIMTADIPYVYFKKMGEERCYFIM